ncbi:unnamed protein product, partial [Vitis vinifera]|uniref:Uncharacterized protein n=1 Tax=Vitis vinifera TaxID=29760 RepID=D7T1M4_VITVI
MRKIHPSLRNSNAFGLIPKGPNPIGILGVMITICCGMLTHTVIVDKAHVSPTIAFSEFISIPSF